jgi:hypothetical protein
MSRIQSKTGAVAVPRGQKFSHKYDVIEIFYPLDEKAAALGGPNAHHCWLCRRPETTPGAAMWATPTRRLPKRRPDQSESDYAEFARSHRDPRKPIWGVAACVDCCDKLGDKLKDALIESFCHKPFYDAYDGQAALFGISQKAPSLDDAPFRVEFRVLNSLLHGHFILDNLVGNPCVACGTHPRAEDPIPRLVAVFAELGDKRLPPIAGSTHKPGGNTMAPICAACTEKYIRDIAALLAKVAGAVMGETGAGMTGELRPH